MLCPLPSSRRRARPGGGINSLLRPRDAPGRSVLLPGRATGASAPRGGGSARDPEPVEDASVGDLVRFDPDGHPDLQLVPRATFDPSEEAERGPVEVDQPDGEREVVLHPERSAREDRTERVQPPAVGQVDLRAARRRKAALAQTVEEPGESGTGFRLEREEVEEERRGLLRTLPLRR